jgi:hypothetical protein
MRRWAALLLVLSTALAACSSGSAAVKGPTTPDRVARLIAEQTRFYERAGASHDDAACLANVTGRMEGPGKGGTGLLLGSRAQDEAIGRCNLPAGTLAKIGAYVRSHPPEST